MRILLALASTAALVAACGPSSPPEQSASPQDTATPSAAPPAEAAAGSMPPVETPAAGEQGGTDNWRQVASAADADNLARLDDAWRLARDEAEDAGFADELKRLGVLVDPSAGQSGRLQPAPGAYRCRTIKMGSKSGNGLAFIDYPYFRCTVELTPGGDLILTKTTGSQRTRGLIYPDSALGHVFVGAQAWGYDEAGYPDYNSQPERDQVGVVQRLGPDHWRLVIPTPRTGGKIDLLDLERQ